jgi:hypothetical protein
MHSEAAGADASHRTHAKTALDLTPERHRLALQTCVYAMRSKKQQSALSDEAAGLYTQLKGAERQRLDLTSERRWLALQACVSAMCTVRQRQV